MTRVVGKGRVASSILADAAWTDWPKHKTFVPFLHGLTKYAAQKTTQDAVQESTSFVAGEDPEIELGSQARLARLKLRKSDGKEIQLTADEKGRLKDPGMSLPGTYSLRDQADHELRRFAVNLPAQNRTSKRSARGFSSAVGSRPGESKTDAGSRFVWVAK
jgi:hypothetical protein